MTKNDAMGLLHFLARRLAWLPAAGMVAMAGLAQAAEPVRVTEPEAVAMVKKGIEFIKTAGTEKAYAEITNRQGAFVDRDLYLVVYGLDGVVKAHGQIEKMVGKNAAEIMDVEGRPFVRERLETARRQSEPFWQEYLFTHPETKKVEPKRMYCERLNDVVVCGGVYKR